MNKVVGVLALQGAYQKHVESLSRIGVESRLIRKAAELDDCSALIMPGGESTTISLLMQEYELYEPVKKFAETVETLIIIEENDPFIETEVRALGIACIGKDKIPVCSCFFSEEAEGFLIVFKNIKITNTLVFNNHPLLAINPFEFLT